MDKTAKNKPINNATAATITTPTDDGIKLGINKPATQFKIICHERPVKYTRLIDGQQLIFLRFQFNDVKVSSRFNGLYWLLMVIIILIYIFLKVDIDKYLLNI